METTETNTEIKKNIILEETPINWDVETEEKNYQIKMVKYNGKEKRLDQKYEFTDYNNSANFYEQEIGMAAIHSAFFWDIKIKYQFEFIFMNRNTKNKTRKRKLTIKNY